MANKSMALFFRKIGFKFNQSVKQEGNVKSIIHYHIELEISVLFKSKNGISKHTKWQCELKWSVDKVRF